MVMFSGMHPATPPDPQVVPFLREDPAEPAALEAEIAALEKDLEAARACGDAGEEIRALGLLGDRNRALGQMGRALSQLREAVHLATAHGDEVRLVPNLIRLGTAWQYSGEHTVAESTLRQGLDLAERLGMRDMVGFAFQHLGKVLAELERYQEAHGCFLAALEVRRSLGQPDLVASTERALDELNGRLDPPPRS